MEIQDLIRTLVPTNDSNIVMPVADGLGRLPLEITVLPKSLQVMVPRDSPLL